MITRIRKKPIEVEAAGVQVTVSMQLTTETL